MVAASSERRDHLLRDDAEGDGDAAAVATASYDKLFNATAPGNRNHENAIKTLVTSHDMYSAVHKKNLHLS